MSKPYVAVLCLLMACADRAVPDEPAPPSEDEVMEIIARYCADVGVPCTVAESCPTFEREGRETCYSFDACIENKYSGEYMAYLMQPPECRPLFLDWMICVSELTCEQEKDDREGRADYCWARLWALYDAECPF